MSTPAPGPARERRGLFALIADIPRLLRELMETGTTVHAVPAMTPFASLNRLLGVEALTAFERSLTAET